MTTFHTALDRLAALTVAGIVHNYAVNAVPDTLTRAQLPALLVLPGGLDDSHRLRERGEGFHAVAFSNGARTVTYSVSHLLLVAPVESGVGSRAHLPRLVDLIDTYLSALANDVTLNDALIQPARVEVEPGTFTRVSVRYHGCAFHHTWHMDI